MCICSGIRFGKGIPGVVDQLAYFALMEPWQKNLYSLWVAQFIAVVGLSMVVPFLPFYLKELGVTAREDVKIWSGLLFSAPFLVAAFLQPIWGILGDRYGRKPMIVRAMFGLALANTLMGFARTAPQLLALRFFQGSLSGFVAPSLALLASSTPEEKTGQALGTLQSSLVTGMIIGPLFGGLLAHFMGYRFIFFWTGFFCLGAALITIKLLKENFIRKGERKGSGVRQNLRYVFGSPQLRFMLLLLIMVQFSIMFVAPFLSLYVEFLKFPAEYVGLMTGLVFGITGVTNAGHCAFLGKEGRPGRLPKNSPVFARGDDFVLPAARFRHERLPVVNPPGRAGDLRCRRPAHHQFHRAAVHRGKGSGRNLWHLSERAFGGEYGSGLYWGGCWPPFWG